MVARSSCYVASMSANPFSTSLLAPSWAHLGTHPGPILGQFRALFRSSSQVLAPTWPILAPSSANLAPCTLHLRKCTQKSRNTHYFSHASGAVLGPSWVHLAPFSRPLGAPPATPAGPSQSSPSGFSNSSDIFMRELAYTRTHPTLLKAVRCLRVNLHKSTPILHFKKQCHFYA